MAAIVAAWRENNSLSCIEVATRATGATGLARRTAREPYVMHGKFKLARLTLPLSNPGSEHIQVHRLNTSSKIYMCYNLILTISTILDA